MTAQQMWDDFSAGKDFDASYQAWSFGEDPDKLAQLTLEGIKTATASLSFWYEYENLALPKVGEYSVVLDCNDHAVCVIQTTKISVVPFYEVSALHAYKEGEGDRSLQYWRDVHARFFQEELSEVGIPFDQKMEVVCEEFIRVYP